MSKTTQNTKKARRSAKAAGEAAFAKGMQKTQDAIVHSKIAAMLVDDANEHAKKTAKAMKAPKAKPAKPIDDFTPGVKRVSALDAAAQVLAKAQVPMKTAQLLEAMAEQGLWKSPGGKTPSATLHAAITREIAAKGDASRFTKHDRGMFAAGKGA